MIRIRNTGNQVAKLTEAFQFVEITDTEGAVACLIYMDDKGIVHTVRPGDPEAERYSALFGVKWCILRKLPSDLTKLNPF